MSSRRLRRQRSSAIRNSDGADAAAHARRVRALGASRLRAVGNYRLGRPIGAGSFGRVRLAHHTLLPRCAVAVKQIPRARAGGGELAALAREVDLHARLRHRHVMQLLEVVRTEGSIWLVCELCPGGELYDYLVEQPTGRLSEREARRLLGQLCLAVAYVHDAGFVHRDIKLENVLLDDRCNVKLADFGFVSQFDDNELLDTYCGTTGYAAPEMIRGERYRGRQVDIWSLGVILYALLTGALPFDDGSEDVMRGKVILGDFDIPSHVSSEATDLLRAILVRDASKRLTIPQILDHPWFKKSMSGSGPPPPLSIAPTFRHASMRSLPRRAHSYTAPSSEEIGAVEHHTSAGLASGLAPVPEAPGALDSDAGSEVDVYVDAVAQSDDGATPDEMPTDEDATGDVEAASEEADASPRPTVAQRPDPVLSASPPLGLLNDEALAPSLSTDPFTMPPEDEHTDYYALLQLQSAGSRGVRAHFSRPLEQHLLSTMSALGLDVGAIVRSVRYDACDSASALWWLLLRRAEERENEERLLRSLPRKDLAPIARSTATTERTATHYAPASARTEPVSFPDVAPRFVPESPPAIDVAQGSSPDHDDTQIDGNGVPWAWPPSATHINSASEAAKDRNESIDAASIVSPHADAPASPLSHRDDLSARQSTAATPPPKGQHGSDSDATGSRPGSVARFSGGDWSQQIGLRPESHAESLAPSPKVPRPPLHSEKTTSTIAPSLPSSSRSASPAPSAAPSQSPGPSGDLAHMRPLTHSRPKDSTDLFGAVSHRPRDSNASFASTTTEPGSDNVVHDSPDKKDKGRKNKNRFLNTVRTWLGSTESSGKPQAAHAPNAAVHKSGSPRSRSMRTQGDVGSIYNSSSVSLLPPDPPDSSNNSPSKRNAHKPTLSLSMPRRKRKTKEAVAPQAPRTPQGSTAPHHPTVRQGLNTPTATRSGSIASAPAHSPLPRRSAYSARRSSSLHRVPNAIPGRHRPSGVGARRMSTTSQSSAPRSISRRTSEGSVNRLSTLPTRPGRPRRQSKSGSTLASLSSAPPNPNDGSNGTRTATLHARTRPSISRASSGLRRVDSLSSIASAPRSAHSVRASSTISTAQPSRHRRSSSESHTVVMRHRMHRPPSRTESDGERGEHERRAAAPSPVTDVFDDTHGTPYRTQFYAHRKRPAYRASGSASRSRRGSITNSSEPAPGAPRAVATWLQSWGNPPPDWAGRVDSGFLSPSIERRNELLAMLRPKLRDVFAAQDEGDEDWIDEDDEDDMLDSQPPQFPGYGPAAAGLRPANPPPADLAGGTSAPWARTPDLAVDPLNPPSAPRFQRTTTAPKAKPDSPYASRLGVNHALPSPSPLVQSTFAPGSQVQPTDGVATQLEKVTNHLQSLSTPTAPNHATHSPVPATPTGVNATVPSGPRMRTAAIPTFTDVPIEEEEEED